jgi:membrane protein YqaA with SNARE-associated domain
VLRAVPSRLQRPERSPQADDRAGLGDDELRAYLRRNLVSTAVVLLVLIAGLGMLGVWYDDELQAVAATIFEVLGVPGLALLVFAADSVTSPVPPDVALIVIANSTLKTAWWTPVLLLGLVSTTAGCVAWWIGGHLGRTRFAQLVFQRWLSPPHRALIARYGRLGVVVGALTPVPFSITCYLAGMAAMRLSEILPACAVRIPRLVIYYVLIAESTRLFAS